MPLTEKAVIDRIRRAAAKNRRYGIGIGDDCAVLPLPAGHEALITTDFTLEDVHFRRAWHPAASVGHRCLVRGLSDIAAMGGIPRAVFLSLAVPDKLLQRWIDEFIRGLLQLARNSGIPLAGGDTAQSPVGIMADIVVLGSVPAGKAVLRSGARLGDLIYVTGTVGESVAALNALRDGKKLRPKSRPKHFYPQPRLAVGRYLREKNIATSMIDISDGLSTDLGHICDESEVGAVVYAEGLPGVRSKDDLPLALHGGEEYELLFTAASAQRVPKTIAGVPITLIGEIVRGSSMKLAMSDGRTKALKPGGWQHFE
jgi:thiamine-monophosphate kinase